MRFVGNSIQQKAFLSECHDGIFALRAHLIFGQRQLGGASENFARRVEVGAVTWAVQMTRAAFSIPIDDAAVVRAAGRKRAQLSVLRGEDNSRGIIGRNRKRQRDARFKSSSAGNAQRAVGVFNGDNRRQ